VCGGGVRGMVQVVELLPSKHEVLHSNLDTTKKKKERKKIQMYVYVVCAHAWDWNQGLLCTKHVSTSELHPQTKILILKTKSIILLCLLRLCLVELFTNYQSTLTRASDVCSIHGKESIFLCSLLLGQCFSRSQMYVPSLVEYLRVGKLVFFKRTMNWRKIKSTKHCLSECSESPRC
jgi:hypothetical protein